MSFQRLWIAAACAGSVWLAPHAQAQGTGGTGGTTTTNGSIRVTLVSIGGDEVSTVGQVYVNRQQCVDNATMLFKVDYVPSNFPSMDIYKGEKCNDSGNRESTTSTACDFLSNTQTGGVTMGLMLHVKAQDLIGSDCSAEESKPTLWFLAVSRKMSTESVGSNYGVYKVLEIDTAVPLAPVNVHGGEGENVIPVSWSGGQTNLKGFRIYIDPTAGAPGSGSSGSGASGNGASGSSSEDVDASSLVVDAGSSVVDNGSLDAGEITAAPNPNCPSSVLVGGGSASDLPTSIRKKTLDEPNATGTDLAPGSIGGTHAAIAVVAVDLAGNESMISNVECVDVVKTTSFWDEYQANGGDAVGGCPCSAAGPVQVENAWPIGLAVLALGMSARRRRYS